MIHGKMGQDESGAYLATHESRNFGGDTPEKGTTPNLKFWKFADFDKQIVYIGVIDPAEFKSDIIFGLGLLLHCHFGYFCQNFEKRSEKLVGQIVGQIRPCNSS